MSRSRGRCVCRCGLGLVSGLGLMSISIDKLNADLLGESEFNLLASGFAQTRLAFLDDFDGILNFGNSDALLLDKDFTGHTGKGDGFVNTGLDGLGVGNGDGDIDGGDDGHVVSSFLSDLLAVVVSVAVSIAITMSGLADGDHLDVGFLLEGDLNSLGGGRFFMNTIVVRADLLRDLFDGLSADCAADIVAVFNVDDDLDGQLNIGTGCYDGRCADIGDFGHITNGAVVLGFLITITAIVRGGVAVGGGGMTVGRGSMVGGSGVVGTVAGGGVGWQSSHEGEKSQESECLS
jgi:hypothetical protein